MSKLVYIASKYNEPTHGAKLKNVHISFAMCRRLYKASDHELVPYSPLWTHYLDEYMEFCGDKQKENEWWYEFDNVIIPKCDALLKLTDPGESKGADAEEVLARKLNIPIFYTLKDIIKWNDSLKED